MTTRMHRLGLATALALLFAAPVMAAPLPDGEQPAATDPRRALDAELPTDRPILATVVKIDEAAGTVMLDTEHGQVALSVSQEVVEQLSVGDVVLVSFTEESEFPSALPRDVPRDEPAPERHKI